MKVKNVTPGIAPVGRAFWVFSPEEDLEANMTLVAEAPELLKELERLRDILNRNNWATNQTDQIIIKAKGGA